MIPIKTNDLALLHRIFRNYQIMSVNKPDCHPLVKRLVKKANAKQN